MPSHSESSSDNDNRSNSQPTSRPSPDKDAVIERARIKLSELRFQAKMSQQMWGSPSESLQADIDLLTDLLALVK